MTHILIVDDEPDVLTTLSDILIGAGYETTTATNGPEALEMIAQAPPDLIILDIIMPEMNGIEVCRRVRADPYAGKVPIMFLTAKGRPADIAEGLDAGGDDYLVKPAQVIELPARVRALLRRAPGGALNVESDAISVGRLRLRTDQTQVELDGEAIDLTDIEYRLLYYLMMRAGRPNPADRLLQDVWGYPPYTGSTNLVQVTISHLRKKLQAIDPSQDYIATVRGQGYLVS